MASDSIAIQVPQVLYRRLERLAELTQRPVDSLVEQTLSANLPPLPEDLPVAWRDALLALERSSDADLELAVRATIRQGDYEKYAALREKNRNGNLAPSEQPTLDHLTAEVDLLPLQKASAAVLLKWRGRRLATLAELAAT